MVTTDRMKGRGDHRQNRMKGRCDHRQNKMKGRGDHRQDIMKERKGVQKYLNYPPVLRHCLQYSNSLSRCVAVEL